MAGLASEQSLAALTGELLAAAAPLDDAAVEKVAADLGAAATVLGDEATLRRLLTEATTEGDARVALARRIFAGKVGDGALALITSAVSQRWSRGRDLVDGLETLSRTAVFLRAERAGEIDEVEDQLFRFGRIVDGTAELSLILEDPATPPDGRAALVRRLLDGRAHPLTVALLIGLARDTSGRSFSRGVAQLVDQAAARRDKLVAVATTAIALTGEETDRLRAALGRIYGRPVAVHVVVDPALGGGMTVRVGDELIDGSVSGRITEIRGRLSRR